MSWYGNHVVPGSSLYGYKDNGETRDCKIKHYILAIIIDKIDS